MLLEATRLLMISAVARTMAILEELSDEPSGITVSQLVARLNCEKSIVSRILSTLTDAGYVIRDPATGTYHIGLRFAGMALRHLDSTGTSDLCQPLLQDVANKTGELIQLLIVQNDQMIYVAKAEGKQRVRVLSLVGRVAALHVSAAGKVWLASLPDERAFAIALKQGMKKFTQNSVTTVDALRAELTRARRVGFAMVEQEMFEDASSVAVPIRGRQGDRVVGAVVLSGPSYRLPKKRMTSLVPILRELADKLSDIANLDFQVDSIESRAIEREQRLA
jgi:DNA-binding IclR family transcriptional regulator